MKLLGARLVTPGRAIDLLADQNAPLPSAHDAFFVPSFPGQAEERVLVLELDDVAVGDVATVSAYPVTRGGRVEVVGTAAGRIRLGARLAPVIALPDALIVDVEHGDEELWSDEIRVVRRGQPQEEPLLDRGHEPPAANRVVEAPGLHALEVHAEPGRLIAQFRCASPALVVARTAPGSWLQPLEWPPSPMWSTDDVKRAEELPVAVRAATARLLAQSALGEARFDRWRGRIALVQPGLDVARADNLTKDIVDLVAMLPPPTGDPPPEPVWPKVDPSFRAAMPRLELRVLERTSAERLCGSLELQLPVRHDPIHGAWLDAPIAPRALVIEAALTEVEQTLAVRSTPPAFAGRTVTLPAGSGRWRTSLPVEMELWTEGLFEVMLDTPFGWTAAHARVPIGRSGTVLLDELAARFPGGRRLSDRTVQVELFDGPIVKFHLQLGVGEAAPVDEWDPARRIARRLLGDRVSKLTGDLDGLPGGPLRELHASARVRATSLHGPEVERHGLRIVEAEQGPPALVADVAGQDVGRIEELARAMLSAFARAADR